MGDGNGPSYFCIGPIINCHISPINWSSNRQVIIGEAFIIVWSPTAKAATRIWCSGIIVPSHGTDRGSIPRMRNRFYKWSEFGCLLGNLCIRYYYLWWKTMLLSLTLRFYYIYYSQIKLFINFFYWPFSWEFSDSNCLLEKKYINFNVQ